MCVKIKIRRIKIIQCMLWDSTPMCLAQPPRSKPNLNETQLTQTQNQNQAKPVAIWPGY